MDYPPHNGAAVLEYGNHLPSFHELPLGFAVRTTIPNKGENDVFVLDSLIPFMPDKNAEVVLITTPHVRNQAAVLVLASGKRQMIAVLQDGCAVNHRNHACMTSKALLQNPWVRQGEIPLAAFEGQEDGQG